MTNRPNSTQIIIYRNILSICYNVVLLLLVVTTTYIYERHCYKISTFLSIILCCVSLLATSSLSLSKVSDENEEISQESISTANKTHHSSSFTSLVEETAFSPSGLYAIYVELLLLMYTVVPLPLLGTLLIGVVYR